MITATFNVSEAIESQVFYNSSIPPLLGYIQSTPSPFME
jgi:hypothetical protein